MKKPAAKKSAKGKRPAKRPADLPVSKDAAARTKGGVLMGVSVQPGITRRPGFGRLAAIDPYQGPNMLEF